MERSGRKDAPGSASSKRKRPEAVGRQACVRCSKEAAWLEQESKGKSSRRWGPGWQRHVLVSVPLGRCPAFLDLDHGCGMSLKCFE